MASCEDVLLESLLFLCGTEDSEVGLLFVLDEGPESTLSGEKLSFLSTLLDLFTLASVEFS